jgi:hypothetical protein
MRFLSLALLPVLPGVAIAGQVRVVGPAPAPYQTVQDAVSSAQEDDIVLVKSGSYESCRTVGRSVTVIADTGANVQFNNAVRVIELPADKLVVLSGLNAHGTYSSSLYELRSGLHVEDSTGQVLVQDCLFQSSTYNVPYVYGCERVSTMGGATVYNSSGVAFARCVLEGVSYPRNTAAGLLVLAPALVSCDSVIARGTDGGPGPTTTGIGCGSYGDAYDGRAGLELNKSYPLVPGGPVPVGPGFVFAADTHTFGGLGGDSCACGGGLWGGGCFCPGRGGDGFRGSDPASQLVLLANTGTPGLGGHTFQPGYPECTATGPTGQPVFTGGSWCFFFHQATPASQLAGTARKLTGSTLVRDNQLASLTFSGVPGEIAELAVSTKAATNVYQPASAGMLHVPSPAWSRVGTVGGTGQLTKAFKMRDLPLSSPGATIVAQARFRNPTTGATRLSNAHVVVVVDKSY